jgi:hypothetical protein
MKASSWHLFLKQNRGMGFSLSELSDQYQHQKQSGGRFMCCRSQDEEKFVRNYIQTHQDEMLNNLDKVGVKHIILTKSRDRDGQLGRFIISFQNAKNQELCHMTLVCGGNHWNEATGTREPHFTINEVHYFYIFDTKTNTLRFRNPRQMNLVPPAIVKTMEDMLKAISPQSCQIN